MARVTVVAPATINNTHTVYQQLVLRKKKNINTVNKSKRTKHAYINICAPSVPSWNVDVKLLVLAILSTYPGTNNIRGQSGRWR